MPFQEVPRWVERLMAEPDLAGHGAEIEEAAALIAAYEPPPQSRLLHGDVSPANTILDGRTVAAIIDFDDAWFGDPAGDMAWWWWNHPRTADDFVAGCAEVNESTDPRTLWIYRLRLLLGLADTFAARDVPRAARIFSMLEVANAETRLLVSP